MDYIDLMLIDKSSNTLCAEHPERISDRDIKKIFRWEKIQSVLPFIRRPQGHEDLMPSGGQFATEIYEMAFAAAKCFCR